KAEDFKGLTHLLKLMLPAHSEENRLKFNLLRLGEETENNIVEILSKDGVVKTVEIYFHRNEKFEIWLFNDVSELKLKEQRLSESDYFIENISKSLPHIIYIFDLNEKKNIYTNQAVNKVLGYTLEEFRKKFKTVFENIHPDDIDMISNHVKNVYSLENERFSEVEYRMKHKNGNYVWLRSKEKIYSRNKDGTP